MFVIICVSLEYIQLYTTTIEDIIVATVIGLVAVAVVVALGVAAVVVGVVVCV